MTVAELIERLKAMPQDAVVVSAGFDETGIDEISTVALISIKRDANKANGHIGPHDMGGPDGEPAVWVDWSDTP